ncbi:ZZ-type zinc finger-containing protein 3 [Frankliniella fusca]|uniref:ZZ-type zinc finger-containing protein 3 n=1 Tax=Frankliniella fusca TaxID=407009 RepID=A0AAE1HNR8_9NEOP|nr:ZZ-type zinc finger-containing protein 3 [Frankliniella fusca]
MLNMGDNEDVISNAGEDDGEPSEFFFESDHLALKGNKDYLDLMKTLAILQAQRNRALQDLETIDRIKKKALNDPEHFISILQVGGDLGVPHRQILAEVPNIEWSEYNASAPMNLHIRPSTRRNVSSVHTKADSKKIKEQDKNGEVTVRGRTFDQNKPETFNQLWTAEEQRRLEELLIEYPPEEVESRRYQKIAEALGNRTRMQVSSRVQKYFLKLMKAGLPVPGRAPRLPAETQKKGSHSRQRANNFLSRPSTFFPQHQDLPVYMSDYDDGTELPENTENCLVKTESTEYSLSDEQRKLNLLKKVKNEKERGNIHHDIHGGFKCDLCGEEPIVGTRWHCMDCPFNSSVDYCSDCVVSQLNLTTPHPSNHRLEAVTCSESTSNESYDPDYLSQSFSQNYNYLDPNFLPH